MGLLTDASYLQLAGEGIHCLDLGIPARYTHAPVEAVSISDMDYLVELLTCLLSEMPAQLDLQRG
jgi:putative aminopeptidase FrvX